MYIPMAHDGGYNLYRRLILGGVIASAARAQISGDLRSDTNGCCRRRLRRYTRRLPELIKVHESEIAWSTLNSRVLDIEPKPSGNFGRHSDV
ncbi:hypothetical protein X777_14810 [Ooceraea biroi]|uniref:Uncharacterized protein n=1 Tax=Ooceraea biroi TaxID=2015173 RepID=A0A026WSM1_OOCBI|nr:hypothetical protein X777_14810 [Ooceraea biroi]